MDKTQSDSEIISILFEHKRVRRIFHDNEWWFVIRDVVSALTGSINPKNYIKDLRRSKPGLAEQWGQIATLLTVDTPGSPQKINCANTENLLRFIQFVPKTRRKRSISDDKTVEKALRKLKKKGERKAIRRRNSLNQPRPVKKT